MILKLLREKSLGGKLRPVGFEFEYPFHAGTALVANGDAIVIPQFTRDLTESIDLRNRYDALQLQLMEIEMKLERLTDSQPINDAVLGKAPPVVPPVVVDEPEPPTDDGDDGEQEEPPFEPTDDGQEHPFQDIVDALQADDWKAMKALAKDYGIEPPDDKPWRKSTLRAALLEAIEEGE